MGQRIKGQREKRPNQTKHAQHRQQQATHREINRRIQGERQKNEGRHNTFAFFLAKYWDLSYLGDHQSQRRGCRLSAATVGLRWQKRAKTPAPSLLFRLLVFPCAFLGKLFFIFLFRNEILRVMPCARFLAFRHSLSSGHNLNVLANEAGNVSFNRPARIVIKHDPTVSRVLSRSKLSLPPPAACVCFRQV